MGVARRLYDQRFARQPLDRPDHAQLAVAAHRAPRPSSEEMRSIEEEIARLGGLRRRPQRCNRQIARGTRKLERRRKLITYSRPDRSALSPLRADAQADQPGGDVLPDGRLGSMTEHMKDLAKRFYALLHLFLKRCYRHVEVVFIRHTDKAEEVDEETFFYSPRDRWHARLDRA
jgi:uncharacterized sporulation protein YeaH/YhbH (DUF444 family)